MRAVAAETLRELRSEATRCALTGANAEQGFDVLVNLAVDVACAKAWYSRGQSSWQSGSFDQRLIYFARDVSVQVEFWRRLLPGYAEVRATVVQIVKDQSAADLLLCAACIKGLKEIRIGNPASFGWWLIRTLALRSVDDPCDTAALLLEACLVSSQQFFGASRTGCFRLRMIELAESVADDQLVGSNFASRVGPYRPLIRKIAARIVKDEDGLNEVESRTLTNCYKSIDQYQPGTSLKSWLAGAAKNQARSLLRERDQADQPPEWLDVSYDGQYLIDRSFAARILSVADQLPDDLKITVRLRHGQELGFEEMAKLLGLPTGTVSSRYYRAIERIRAKMNPGKSK